MGVHRMTVKSKMIMKTDKTVPATTRGASSVVPAG